MFPQKFSCFIPDEELDKMYSLYFKHVFIEKNEIGLTEKNREYTPIKIDIDFKFNENDLVRKYTIDHIKQLIVYYMEIIEQWYVLSDKERLCFVMEKKAPRKKGNSVKDGIHIMFPFLVTETKIQFLFREYVLEKIDNIISSYNLINTKEDVVDQAVINKNGWLLYGSIKSDDTDSYIVTHIFEAHNKIDEIKELENNYSNEALVRILSIRAHFGDNERTMMRQEKEAELVEKYEDINVKYYKSNKKCDTKPKQLKELNEDELENIKMFIDCLSEERATSRDTWMKVGWAIHNLGSNPILLEYWIEFSKKSEKHINEAEEVCSLAWDTMEYGNCGFGSIVHWAKNDNPQQVETIGYETSKKNILKSLDCCITGKKSLDDEIRKHLNISSENVAQILYDNYKDYFRMVGKKGKGTYYQYYNHRWMEMDGYLLLREKISTKIKKDYEKCLYDIFTNPTQEQKEIQEKN
jgi:hypothetical protein